MCRRLSLVFLALASPLTLGLSLIPGPIPEWIFSIVVTAFPMALIAIAIGGRSGPGARGPALLAMLVFFEACVVGMLVFRGQVLDATWFGGLPPAAAIQVYGLFLAPLLPVALLYALTFDRFELKKDDLDRLARYRRPRGGG